MTRRRLAAQVAIALCVAGTVLAAPTPAFADSSRQPAITEVRAEGAMLRIDGVDLGGGTPKLTLGSVALANRLGDRERTSTPCCRWVSRPEATC